MPYEVTAAADAPTDRLVVSVANQTLVFGEALDEDREAEGVHVVADASEPFTGGTDIASELALLSDRIPEVAAAVQVEYVPEEEDVVEHTEEVVEVTPADPADSVVPAGETTPDIERSEETVVERIEDTDVLADPAPEQPAEPTKTRRVR